MNPAMSPNSTVRATDHWVASGIALPPVGTGREEEDRQADDDGHGAEPLLQR